MNIKLVVVGLFVLAAVACGGSKTEPEAADGASTAAPADTGAAPADTGAAPVDTAAPAAGTGGGAAK